MSTDAETFYLSGEEKRHRELHEMQISLHKARINTKNLVKSAGH